MGDPARRAGGADPQPFDGYRDAVRYDVGLGAFGGRRDREDRRNRFSTPSGGRCRPRRRLVNWLRRNRTVRPVTETGSPLMKERTFAQALAYTRCRCRSPVDAAHRAFRLNDAFVAGVAGDCAATTTSIGFRSAICT